MKNASPAKAKRDPREAPVSAKSRSDATAKSDPGAPPRGAALRKLTPKSKLPTASVLKRLSAADVEIIEKALSEPMECVYNAEFPKVNAERRFCEPLDDGDAGLHPVMGGDPFVPAASSTESLTAADERRLFMCLNYCRYRAMRVVRDSRAGRLTVRAARELVRWSRAALTIRTRIVEANLSLVPAMAKRRRSTSADIADLICEGQPGAGAQRRQVRLRARLQVQHLRLPGDPQQLLELVGQERPLSRPLPDRVRSSPGEERQSRTPPRRRRG